MAANESQADAVKGKEEPEKMAAEVEEDIPDPDEDDLDDLDDMLDDFSSLKVDAKKPAAAPAAAPEPVAPAEAPPAAAAGADEANLENPMSDDDFAQQLQAGMADLLGELESSPEMQAQFDSIFKELGAAAASGEIPVPETPATAAPSGGASTPGGGSFQDTIRQTMERMQASGEQATAAASAEGSDDFLAELMKQMESGGLGGGGGGGEGGEEDFSKMLLGMMEQLTNKEILYEPMKELNDKFPEWLEKNRDKTPEADLKRYVEQQAMVKEIVAKFDQPTFSDANAEDRQYIVDRMQKMQSFGSPPPDLVGDMPSAQDALGMSDENCNMQ